MKHIIHIIRTSLITNFLLSIFKLIIGVLGKSNALIADGIHSFSDLATDIVALFGSKFASKPADEKHPFGHGKLEYLTSLCIGVVVLLVGFSLISKSTNTTVVVPSMYVVFASLFTIIVKFALARHLINSGKKYDNTVLIASGKESRADVISSLVVLFAGIGMQLSSYVSILKYSDIVASIIVGIFIVHTGFVLIKENVSVIIGEQETNEENLEKLRSIILSDKNILKIDRLNVLKFGYYYSVMCEIAMDENMPLGKCHEIIDCIEEEIKYSDDRYHYVIIHVNPETIK